MVRIELGFLLYHSETSVIHHNSKVVVRVERYEAWTRIRDRGHDTI